jgi:hypothetical protein
MMWDNVGGAIWFRLGTSPVSRLVTRGIAAMEMPQVTENVAALG